MRIILLEFWVVSSTSWIQVDQECYMKSTFFPCKMSELVWASQVSTTDAFWYLAFIIPGLSSDTVIFFLVFDSVFVKKK